MAQLHRTEPHYIRCIKPNPNKAALSFYPRMCYEQLTYSGVFEAVAIRKQGYPFRLSHKDFAERYGKLLKGADGSSGGGDARRTCKDVIKQMKLSTENVKIGKTRVLYRAMEYRKLELDWSILTKNENILKDLARLTKMSTSGMSEGEKEDFIVDLAAAVREADKFK